MQNSDHIWTDIRATTEHLSVLSVHLREAAMQARRRAETLPQQNDLLHLELLENLKRLADSVRDILWRELRSGSQDGRSSEIQSRAAELFGLLARMSAAQGGSKPRSFIEQLESSVERTLSRAAAPGEPDPDQRTEAA